MIGQFAHIMVFCLLRPLRLALESFTALSRRVCVCSWVHSEERTQAVTSWSLTLPGAYSSANRYRNDAPSQAVQYMPVFALFMEPGGFAAALALAGDTLAALAIKVAPGSESICSEALTNATPRMEMSI